jgi:hypothetical protein
MLVKDFGRVWLHFSQAGRQGFEFPRPLWWTPLSVSTAAFVENRIRLYVEIKPRWVLAEETDTLEIDGWFISLEFARQ